MLNLNQDGSFSVLFSGQRCDRGAEGYSYTMYCSDFTGKFTEIKKLNDHVYSMHTDLQLEQESGTQEIIDDCLKVYSEPYGLVPDPNFICMSRKSSPQNFLCRFQKALER